MEKKKENRNILIILLLHVLLLVFSCAGIFSKFASRESFLSLRFCLLYGGLVFILGIYAVFWQQIIKRLPLTFAYANKAVTVIWGMVWGVIFFGEQITAKKLIGAAIVFAGVVLYSLESKHERD